MENIYLFQGNPGPGRAIIPGETGKEKDFMKKTHMKEDEMEIVRAVSADLGGNVMAVLTLQYHTELDPSTGRNDRSKSRWRLLGRVDGFDAFNAAFLETRKDENRLLPWKWPDDPGWNGRILYMNDSTNAGRSNWLRLKIMKALRPDAYLKALAGYRKAKDAKRGAGAEAWTEFNPASVWPSKGWKCSDGTTVDVDDVAALRLKRGTNVWAEVRMTSAGPEIAKGAE